MSEREVRKCSKCSRYSFKVGRCLDGMINPPTKKGAVSAAKIMGYSYICPWAKWKLAVREELLKQVASERSER
jgi:hypothetical protein